ncbi:MAG: hypothetical protein HHAS10_09830 [Candidatus Altimarinota bacterium]
MQKKNFNLDKNFYPQALLEEAISEFESFDIQSIQDGISIQDEDPQGLFDEFSNYCVALYNEKLI